MISAQGLGYTFSAKDLASGPIRRLSGNVKGLAATSESAQLAYNKNMALIKAGTRSLMIGGLGLLAINSLTKAYGEFEYKLISAGAVMGATATEMRALEKAAIGAGIATQFSPAEAAQGLENLGAAGMSAATAIKVLNPVLDLAAASLGQLGVGEAAANVVGVLNAFGDSANYATKRVDQLVRITQMSNFQARDFSVAISQAAAQASSADQTFESMTATLGMLRNTNMDASSAATAYREAVRRVAGDKRALRALRKLDIHTLDKETGKIKDLGKIMVEVIPAMQKLNAQKRNLNLKTIFGIRGMKTYNAFLASYNKQLKEGKVKVGDYAGAHRKLVEGLEKSEGAAARTRDKLLASAKGQRILLKGSIETFKVVAGKALIPAVLPALKQITSVLNVLIKVFEAIPSPLRSFISFFATAGAVMLMFGGAIKVIAGARGLMALKSGMDSAAAATTRMTFAQAQNNAAMAAGGPLRQRLASRISGVRAAITGSLPYIGLGVAALMGYFAMLDEREKKEKKRLQEIWDRQRRMQSEYKRTAASVADIGKAAQNSVDKLVKLGRAKDLHKLQEDIRKNLAVGKKAAAEMVKAGLLLHKGGLTKEHKAELIAKQLKLQKEVKHATERARVGKIGEMLIRGDRTRGFRKTEDQKRSVAAASNERIRRMNVHEGKLQVAMLAAIGEKQWESAKKLGKKITRLDRARTRRIKKTARLAGYKGKDVVEAEKFVTRFADPKTKEAALPKGAMAPPGVDPEIWATILRDPTGALAVGRHRFVTAGAREELPGVAKKYEPRFGTTGIEGGVGATGFGVMGAARGYSTVIDQMVNAFDQMISEARAEAELKKERLDVHLSIDGQDVPTTNKNRNKRTLEGKPTNPPG